MTPPSACSTGQIYHLRTTHSNYHEICKNCTCIIFFVEILITFVHDCCTVKNMTSHLMYLYFPFVSNSAVIGYNFHFVFNSLNSASAEGASTLNDVAVIVVYSYAQLQLHYLHFLMTLNIL